MLGRGLGLAVGGLTMVVAAMVQPESRAPWAMGGALVGVILAVVGCAMVVAWARR